MTLLSDGTPPTRPPVRYVWSHVPNSSDALRCEHPHGPSGGRQDETARRLSHEEFAVARLLAAEGHDVRSLPEPRRGGRHPDLLVCGRPLEVKSFAPASERRRDPTPYSVFNKLVDAGGQASHAVLAGAGSGLSESVARQGVARYAAGRERVTRLCSVRILGDGYDLAWAKRPSLQLPAGLWAPPMPRSPAPDLGI